MWRHGSQPGSVACSWIQWNSGPTRLEPSVACGVRWPLATDLLEEDEKMMELMRGVESF